MLINFLEKYTENIRKYFIEGSKILTRYKSENNFVRPRK